MRDITMAEREAMGSLLGSTVVCAEIAQDDRVGSTEIHVSGTARAPRVCITQPRRAIDAKTLK